jgi:UPF0716 family protein affecting phage T7 exclusion
MTPIIMPYLGFILLFAELFLLIQFGRVFGGGAALAEVLISGFLGYSAMRTIGRTAFQPALLIGVFLHGLRPGMSSRRPVEWLLLGSLLLIIPGLLTDIAGLVLLARYFLHRGPRTSPPRASDSIDVDFDVHDDAGEK